MLVSCKKEISNNEGQPVEFHDFTGQKIYNFYKDKNYKLIILNYWATYCSPCKEEMNDFVKLYSSYQKDNIMIIGATSETKENFGLIQKLCKILKINYPILYGVENEFNNETILGLPTTFILDKELNIIEKIDGKRDLDYFKNIIEK